MGNSLGDYNIEKSSSSDINNIKWTKKNPSESKSKDKKKTKQRPSAPNIVYANETKVRPHAEKFFKVKTFADAGKLKNNKEKINKRIQTSSVYNSKIKQSFSRRAR